MSDEICNFSVFRIDVVVLLMISFPSLTEVKVFGKTRNPTRVAEEKITTSTLRIHEASIDCKYISVYDRTFRGLEFDSLSSVSRRDEYMVILNEIIKIREENLYSDRPKAGSENKEVQIAVLQKVTLVSRILGIKTSLSHLFWSSLIGEKLM